MLFVILTFLDCKCKHSLAVPEPVLNLSGKPELYMVLTNLFMVDKTLYSSDGNNILLEIKVKNHSNKSISIGSKDYYPNSGKSDGGLLTPNGELPSSQTASIFISGFYLISNELQTGAFKLNANTENLIEANHFEYITQWSNCVYLRHLLKRPVPKEEETAYNDILDFFTKGSYSLIYISSNDSSAYVIPKSENFKVIITNSLTTELRKISEK